MAKMHISLKNNKMGPIASVSLPAGTTCNPNAPCFKACYARRMAAYRANIGKSYAENLEVLNSDPGAYWSAVYDAAFMTRYFRYHVSGDIPDMTYLKAMVILAEALPHTEFLAFTKQHEIINAYLDNGGTIPANLHMILSNWYAWKSANPHNLPVCEVYDHDDDTAPGWQLCGGNCTACAKAGRGCWNLRNGETIAIKKH